MTDKATNLLKADLVFLVQECDALSQAATRLRLMLLGESEVISLETNYDPQQIKSTIKLVRDRIATEEDLLAEIIDTINEDQDK